MSVLRVDGNSILNFRRVPALAGPQRAGERGVLIVALQAVKCLRTEEVCIALGHICLITKSEQNGTTISSTPPPRRHC